MPKTWLYIFALVLPLIFSGLLLHTGMLSWLWYNGYPETYTMLSPLTINVPFLTYLGGWAFPIFVATMCGYWIYEHEDDAVASQFLLVPIAYVPFSIAVTMISRMQADFSLFYIQPLVIIPIGYMYVACWVFIIWILEKLRLAV
ncbi:MAG: hypothetical protein EBR02_04350 [Alphaproteobacteria bacterium]|nr:hypothetical protein [Alphaproteobacteria bacterium]